MPDAKVTNGGTRFTAAERRYFDSLAAHAPQLAPRLHAGQERPRPRENPVNGQGGARHAAANGAGWSTEDAGDQVEKLGSRLRTATQALGRRAYRLIADLGLYALDLARLVREAAHWAVKYLNRDRFDRGDLVVLGVIGAGGAATVLLRWLA
jgi:hypothetical protein